MPVGSIALPWGASESQSLPALAWAVSSHHSCINGAARHLPSHVQVLSGKALEAEGSRTSSLGDPVVLCHRAALGLKLDFSLGRHFLSRSRTQLRKPSNNADTAAEMSHSAPHKDDELLQQLS